MAQRKELKFAVEVNGDISGLKKAMNDAVAVFNSTQRAIKNIDKALEADPNDANLLEQKYQLQKKAIKENEQAIKDLQKIEKEIVNDKNYQKGITDRTERWTELQRKKKELIKTNTDLKNALKETSKALSSFPVDRKFDNLQKQLKLSKDALEKMQGILKDVNERIKLDPSNIDNYRLRQSYLNEELKIYEVSLNNLKKKQLELESDPGFKTGIIEKRNEYEKLRSEIVKLEAEYNKLKSALSSMPGARVEMFLNQARSLGQGLKEISAQTRALSRTFTLMAGASIKASMDYESSIANIRRVVSDLSEETIQDLKDIAVETGNTFSDVAEYGTIAGALGIEENKIAQFAKTMTDLNTATGGVFSGEEGAKGIAVFLKQLNLGIDQAENFGSAIAVIGDKYADIGDETVNVATRLTGLNSIINTNQYELIGLAGVMADLGLASDSSANGVNRAFLQIDKILGGGVKGAEAKLEELAETSGMTSAQFRQAWEKNAVDTFLKFTDGLKSSVFNEVNKAIDTSDEKVMEFADILGLSAEQFKRAWGEDSQKVFNQYVEALGEMDEEGVVASKVLGDLGIASVNTAQTLLRLAGSGNDVREAIKLTEQAWNENTALTEKSNIIYETTERKLKGLWESLKQFASSVVDEFGPTIKKVLDRGTELFQMFSQLNPTTKKFIGIMVAMGASVSPVTGILGRFLSNLTGTKLALAGAGGLIALIGTLSAMARNNGKSAFEELSKETENLSEQLRNSNVEANKKYLQDTAYLETADKLVEKIDILKHKLGEEGITTKKAGEYKKKINEYVEKLNKLLGDEYVQFSEANGQLVWQGELVDELRGKFEGLSFEIRKGAWLEAHQDTISKATEAYEKANEGMLEAGEKYSKVLDKGYGEITKGEVKRIREAMMAYQGDIDEVTKLFNNGSATQVPYDLAYVINTIHKEYGEMMDTVNGFTDVKKQSNQIVEDFQRVQESTVDDFDAKVYRLQQDTANLSTSLSDAYKNYNEQREVSDILKTVLPEQAGANADLLEVMKQQGVEAHTIITELESASGVVQTVQDQFNSVTGDIDAWGATPLVKDVSVNVKYNLAGIGGLGGPLGLGFFDGLPNVFDSSGFGDIMSNTMNAINRTMSNQMSSNGFGGRMMSGAHVTLNNSWVINNQSITEQMARNFANAITSQINENLGRMI